MKGMRKGWRWFLRVWRLKLFELYIYIFLGEGVGEGDGRKEGSGGKSD